MLERLKNIKQKLEEMPAETLQTYKYALFGIVIADVFGIWWYMGWKQLGGALLIISLIALAIIMFYENKKLPPEDLAKVPDKKKPKKIKTIKEESAFDFLPSYDDYEKRVKQAMG